ncbi:MAG: aminopeptidase P family protein [Planctomycetes bacterium]|nr:aminopeptidase P family protein [Planctomycetota bacterium]
MGASTMDDRTVDGGAKTAALLWSASEKDGDILHATRFMAPDPFGFAEIEGVRWILVADLELGRARATARVDRVACLDVYKEALRAKGNERPRAADALAAFLKEQGVGGVRVPGSFPFGVAEDLRAAGISVRSAPDPFFPQREVKTEEEMEAIAEAQAAAEEGLRVAHDLLAASSPRDGILVLDGQPLTAEALRRKVHLRLLELDFAASHTIIACGDQACDPHDEGSGPLRPDAAIICDIYPRSIRTGYWGDTTRTFVRGRASQELLRMYEAVREAQEIVFAEIRDGADGTAIHRKVEEHFAGLGFETGRRDGAPEGFFHGTGHGLGVEIHEMPRIHRDGSILREGNVVTVEPGLYYRGIGGVRIEDLVAVTRDGCRNLSTFPKELEIR